MPYNAVMNLRTEIMGMQIVFHEAEEGGYWAEVPDIPGCATQGEDLEELLRNLREAVEGCLAVGRMSGEIREGRRCAER